MNPGLLKPNIFNYSNFRAYLKDFIDYLRKKNPAFRLQTLVEEYGLRSRAHCIDVIKGRKLTKKFLEIYLKICGFADKEAEYFRALVGYDQARNGEEKIRCFSQIVRLSPNLTTVQLEQEVYRYFSQWYYPVMLSVLDLNRGERDHRKLARMFKPKISAVQARQALDALIELKFIAWDETQQRWVFLHKFFKCTDGARVAALKGFHEKMQQLGAQAYRSNFNDQAFSTLTLSTSVETKKVIEQMIVDTRNAIMEKVKADGNSEIVVQVNFQVFDLSMRKGKNGKIL